MGKKIFLLFAFISILGAGRAEGTSAKSLFDEARQIADVIEMRVGEHDGVYGLRGNRKVRPVSQPQRLETLKQTAVDEHTSPLHLEQVTGAGHRTSGAEKGQ